MNIQETHLNTPFVRKLSSILSDPDYTEIITWDETGTMIDILDEKRIQSEILPKFFRHSKFQSFIRQLNLYGFKKMKNKNCHRFRHPDLVKGNSLFSIKSQRKFKNSTQKQNPIQKFSHQVSQMIENRDLVSQKSRQKESSEIGQTKKLQASSQIENKTATMFSVPFNFQGLYEGMYGLNGLNLCQPVNNFHNYGFQTVYLPNFNNILFYN